MSVMDENERAEPRAFSAAAGMLVTEAVVTAVILLTVLVVKYFFGGTYARLADWYTTNICAETTVEEVVETAGGGIDAV